MFCVTLGSAGSGAGAFRSPRLRGIREGIAPAVRVDHPGRARGEMLLPGLGPDAALPALRGFSSVRPAASGPLKIACLRYV